MTTKNIIPTQLELPLTPQDLNKRASQLITELHHYTFNNLPLVLENIIQSKSWSKLPTKFKNFGEYALSQSVDGLCIDSNEKLWVLRSAMNVNKTHIQEWKDVLMELEKMIKTQPKLIQQLGNRALSLERLAKSPELSKRITYYPPQATGGDRDILRLNTKNESYLRRIAVGEISKGNALVDAGFSNQNKNLVRAKSALATLNQEDKEKIIKWMKETNFLKGNL